jgi:hypothetical protein
MAEKTQFKNSSTAADQLREEYERQSALFDVQPPIVQRFLEAQARQIAQAYVERSHTVRFRLPDRVTISEKAEQLTVYPSIRDRWHPARSGWQSRCT